ncbi:hypothetical protein CEP51_013041 [Fusarium floridanum]|uniref:DUF7514 domain-containing protein n=1 Tax=Fusarium floridanum TaxID=1325733 RepID=A0A428QIG8_9HYPO|nr:hypothetical protein CEP51_013041 [Fusarium floridanum]
MLSDPSSYPVRSGGGGLDRKPAFRERIQIPDDTSSVESGDAQMKKRLSADMSKEQVEELVRKLTIDEMKTKWFDEIFAKVKSELVEHPSPDTPSSSEPSSPKSNPIDHKSSFQATVEDDPEDPMTQSFESSRRTSNRSSAASTCSPTSSFISETKPTKPALVNHNHHSPSESPQHSPKIRQSVRFSDRGPVILNGKPATTRSEAPPRPEPPAVDVLGNALSAVDQKWGRLFDDRGEPTARLGQVLRGIANYLIAEYTPHNSLVVTPEKLNQFYATYKLESEAFPFQQIFDCNPHGALDNLETLYQHLRCENHLVQRRPTGMPHIPSLTPSGFERWMICQIQTFPDQEAKRLNRVIADLPITADGPLVDGKPERLPKQLSRHLFPADRQRETHDLVVNAISDWIKMANENDIEYRRASFDESHKSSSSRDEGTGRYRPDDYRNHDSSKYRRGSRDNYKSSSSRTDTSSRFIPRVNSDNAMKPSKEHSPPPTTTSNHRSRSPMSNRYRHSTSALESSSSPPDSYDLVSSSHRYPSSRRNREKEYRHYQGREPKTTVETTPRSIPRERRSLIVEGSERDPNGLTYDEYMRLNPRAMRNVVVDDGGHYRTPHTNGTDERSR